MDIALLDPRLVQLLAMQRVQQLFAAAGAGGEVKTEGSSASSSSSVCSQLPSARSINGLKPAMLYKPVKPVLTAG